MPTCKGCFLECGSYEMVPPRYARPYPCSLSTRLWAARHRHDPGDEFGFVRESGADAEAERLYLPGRGAPTPPDVRERWVALVRDGYASMEEAAEELGVTLGAVRKWMASS